MTYQKSTHVTNLHLILHLHKLFAWFFLKTDKTVQAKFQYDRPFYKLWEAGSWGCGQFGNPEEGECLPVEATIKQRLVNTVTDWEDLACPIVIYVEQWEHNAHL
jgi:hypothetical protein